MKACACGSRRSDPPGTAAKEFKIAQALRDRIVAQRVSYDGTGGRMATKDESEAFYQMLEALMSARRYILAQQYYPPERLAEIDAAIRHAEAEQRGHLTGEN